MIGGNTIVAKVDAQAGVPVDRVGEDRVARARIRRICADDDATEPVEGDHVAGARGRAANRVVGGAAANRDAPVAIPQRERPGRVGADQVALHEISAGPGGRVIRADENSRIPVA